MNVCLFVQSHTILLVQPTKRPEGRTYADYESVNECMEGRFYTNCIFYLKFYSVTFPFHMDKMWNKPLIVLSPPQRVLWTNCFFCFFSECLHAFLSGVCKMYEEHLKRMNPNSPSITYDISQLFDFIDDLADLSCLV